MIYDKLNCTAQSAPYNRYEYPQQDIYGLAVYDYLCEKLIDPDGGKGWAITRGTMRMLAEHKQFMVSRLSYLKTLNVLSNDSSILLYKEVHKLSKIAEKVFLEYEIGSDQKLVLSICRYFLQIKRLEKEALQILLYHLRLEGV